MSAKKALDQISQVPPPRDFSWEKLMTLMTHHDFKASCRGGSHYTFIHSTGLKVKLSKTHPSGVLKAYQLAAVIEGLKHIGAIPETDNE